MSEAYDFDRELDEVERFIAAVQAGDIGTSAAMAAYRDRHRPAIARLRAELASFRALLAEEDEEPTAEDAHPAAAGEGVPRAAEAVRGADATAGVVDEGVAQADLDASPTRHPGRRDDPEDDA